MAKLLPDQTSLFETEQANDIIDLDLSVTKKKKFRFDHDDNRIVELNVSDIGIMSRMTDIYGKLQSLQNNASELLSNINVSENMDENAEAMKLIAERLKDIDTNMRLLIDELFDADVSAKAAPDGSMYDLFEGSFRFEHIILLLLSQYENNLTAEYKKMEKQLKKHTAKYNK